MAEFPERKPVIKSWFRSSPRALQVELPNQACVIPSFRNQLTNQRRATIEGRVSISRIVRATRVQARHETRSTGCADWALAISLSERNPCFDQGINGWCPDIWISERANGVEALLIRAIPQNIWATIRHEVVVECWVNL